MSIRNFIENLFQTPTTLQCENCHKHLFEKKSQVRVCGKILCKQCADWSDEYLNEMQMHEGGFECGGGIDDYEF